MDRINVAVFPCGSEVGLEINRALRFSRHFKIWGLNSVADHGQMVYKNYLGTLPSFRESGFINTLKKIVKKCQIRFLIPTMDEVAASLKEHEEELGCEVVCADQKTIRLLTSKSQTYSKLRGKILVPEIYNGYKCIRKHLPVFTKPDKGYGSRNTKLIISEEQLSNRWKDREGLLFIENLPGNEYTIDCFSDKNHKILFTGPRIRNRIRMGISVNTIPVEIKGIENIARKISDALEMKGTWFFQMKENRKGKLVLLEVASRVSGSMALNRLQGVNFVLLELFQRLGYPINIYPCPLPDMELERSFDCKLKTSLEFDIVYIDFDDCLMINGKLNTQMVRFLYQQVNAGKKIILLTKHDGDLSAKLNSLRIESLFDEIIHIDKMKEKYRYIKQAKSIFIDDSHKERQEVKQHINIPAFAPDTIGSLIDYRKL
jgi:hypothetical protein